jgi:hypothetical protein
LYRRWREAWGDRRDMVDKYGKGAEHVSGPEHDGWSSDIARLAEEESMEEAGGVASKVY